MQKQSDLNQEKNSLNLPTSFIFHEDPGHGWLEVPLQAIKTLGIHNKITGYSYRSGDKAYLEEDLDAVTFISAYLTAVGHEPDDWTYFHSMTEERWVNGDSFIRNLPRFT